MALERLAKLERPIKWLANDLENSTNNDYRRDGAKIHDKLLSNEEFKVVKALVELLCPFDKATEILSRSNYATLSIMVPIIEELVHRLNNTDSDFNIINEVKEEILSNLSSRWSLPHDYGMYASLLDPRFKNLSFCSNTLKQRTIEGLRNQFNELKSISQAETNTSLPREEAVKKKNSAMKSFFSSVQQQHDEFVEQTEIDKYLALPEIETTEENDLVVWWKQRRLEFPILCTLAKKYLAIPASSVPSERLFSDAGNHVTLKRNRLDPYLLHQLLFLKRNLAYVDIFPPIK
ncbi:11740_t:CDS:2 [Dentiscutata heterogama]|uniref:11740_t:CDS:1 n=1 Tax=Dentiscutata heterogama TaxID=1316150 RepID=A0ACA9MGD5_9GLOM|nr:11740_t:CDS:2 [Dentiscutata heterogama]